MTFPVPAAKRTHDENRIRDALIADNATAGLRAQIEARRAPTRGEWFARNMGQAAVTDVSGSGEVGITLKDIEEEIAKAGSSLRTALDGIYEKAGDAVKTITDEIGKAGSTIRQALDGAYQTATAAATALVGYAKEAWVAAKGYATEVWVTAKGFISDVVKSITDNASAIATALYAALKQKFDLVYGVVTGVVKTVTDEIGKAGSSIRKALDGAYQTASAAATALVGYAKEAWVTAKGYVTQAWVNAQKFISDLVGSITKNATAVGNALYGALKLKFDLVYSSVLGGVSEAWVNAQGFITNVVTAVTANASAVANALYASLKPKFDLLYNAVTNVASEVSKAITNGLKTGGSILAAITAAEKYTKITLSGNKDIDLTKYSNGILNAVLTRNSVVTFSNVPSGLTSIQMYVKIDTSANVTLSVAGFNIDLRGVSSGDTVRVNPVTKNGGTTWTVTREYIASDPVASANIILNGNVAINLARYSANTDIICTIRGNSVVTFSNALPSGAVNFKVLKITRDRTSVPALTVAGTTISLADIANKDNLDVTAFSVDGGRTWTVKKKARRSGTVAPAVVPPGIPINLTTRGTSSSTVYVEWLAPAVADIPTRKYDLWYDTTGSRGTDGSLSGSDLAKVTGIDTGHSRTITGLKSGTVYYFIIRTTDKNGTSPWSGYSWTDTDPSKPTASDIDFKVTATTATSVTLAWKNPGSKYRFSLYRDTPGTKREFFHKQTGTGYVDTSLIDPQTSYTYSLQVWEVNANVGIWPASARTPNLAAPSWTLTTRGLKLVFTVTMPIGVSSGDVEWSTNSNFAGAVRRSMTRDVLLSGSAGSAVYESSSLTNALYYARVRLRKNAVVGGWSTSKSVTPKGYLAPYGPRSVNATSPAVGQVRLRWSWGGDYRGETGIIERKKNIPPDALTPTVVGVTTFVRGSGDARDLDTRADRVEILLKGQPSGETWSYYVDAINESGRGYSRGDDVSIK